MMFSSNKNGRAYEYAVISALSERVQRKLPTRIIQNASLRANKKAWNSLDIEKQKTYILSSNATLETLQAFISEIEHANDIEPSFIKRMFSYLVGVRDYYKIISRDDARLTLIETFNLNSTLNKSAKNKRAEVVAPQLILPTELVAIKLRKDSKTTVDIYMDGGWQFSFRLHNASSKVEPSLKFDINFQALPPEVRTFKLAWN